jgi:hypothetical protein
MTSIDLVSRRASWLTCLFQWSWYENLFSNLKISLSLVVYGMSLIFQKESTNFGTFSVPAFNVYRCSSSIVAILCIKAYYTVHSVLYRQLDARDSRKVYLAIDQDEIVALNHSNFRSKVYNTVVFSLSLGVLHSAASSLQLTSLKANTPISSGFVTEMILIIVPLIQILVGNVFLQTKNLLFSLLFCLMLSILSFLLLSECSDDRLFCIKDGDPLILLSTVLWSLTVVTINVCNSIGSTQTVNFFLYAYVVSLTINILYCFFSVSKESDWKLILSTQQSLFCYYGMGSGLCEIFAVLLIISSLRTSFYSLLSLLLLSFEGVVTAIFCCFYLKETLTATQVIGGLIMTLVTMFAC